MDVSTPAHEKKMAALASVGSAVVLVCLKVFLVVATGSLGVLSEALHSSLDLTAARFRSSRRRTPSLRPREV
jgi:divalent metal cation (Fe/Co/Zn/Cd) transporter